MVKPDDRLALARRLVPPPGGMPATPSPPDADLHCGIAEAYYALFHLLVAEATARVVADPSLWSRAGRTIQHKTLKDVCERCSPQRKGKPAPVTTSGLAIPVPLQLVAAAFTSLQAARLAADYDSSRAFSHAEADELVSEAEAAFLHWAAAKADPAASEFLAEIFLRGFGK